MLLIIIVIIIGIHALGNGNFKDCTIKDKSGENIGGIYENCTLENISGNIHGTFNISNSTINNWNVLCWWL